MGLSFIPSHMSPDVYGMVKQDMWRVCTHKDLSNDVRHVLELPHVLLSLNFPSVFYVDALNDFPSALSPLNGFSGKANSQT